jgi:hypothetical protein
VVVHDQGIHYKLPGYAESEGLISKLAGIYYARITEGSPRHRDGLPAHHVVHNLMSAEDVYGIGPGVSIY